ncbi:MAG TPA: hypothetical protein VGE19_14610 [Pseudoxanthomonas sp.]
MIGPILQFQDLQRLCRPDPHAPPPRLATVVRWADRQGIPFKYDGDGGIFTTVDAVNAALGLGEPTSPQRLTADQVF